LSEAEAATRAAIKSGWQGRDQGVGAKVAPPRYVRVVRYRYQFTNFADRSRTGIGGEGLRLISSFLQ